MRTPPRAVGTRRRDRLGARPAAVIAARPALATTDP